MSVLLRSYYMQATHGAAILLLNITCSTLFSGKGYAVCFYLGLSAGDERVVHVSLCRHIHHVAEVRVSQAC